MITAAMGRTRNSETVAQGEDYNQFICRPLTERDLAKRRYSLWYGAGVKSISITLLFCNRGRGGESSYGGKITAASMLPVSNRKNTPSLYAAICRGAHSLVMKIGQLNYQAGLSPRVRWLLSNIFAICQRFAGMYLLYYRRDSFMKQS